MTVLLQPSYNIKKISSGIPFQYVSRLYFGIVFNTLCFCCELSFFVVLFCSILSVPFGFAFKTNISLLPFFDFVVNRFIFEKKNKFIFFWHIFWEILKKWKSIVKIWNKNWKHSHRKINWKNSHQNWKIFKLKTVNKQALISIITNNRQSNFCFIFFLYKKCFFHYFSIKSRGNQYYLMPSQNS